ncbi:P-loop containing nucleoside triphosphate hydrolase protein, partial [Atractiella rhizophila]
LTPFQKAAQILHVSATPEFLPCRDEEFVQIESFLEDAIDEGTGGCLYVAGVPGTGKTATVLSVVKVLQERAAQGEIAPFRFCEINGMKLTEPPQAFVSLWEFLENSSDREGEKKIGPKQALKKLETYFDGGAPGRETCVVLVDELDQLITKKQEVIYNFFDWPNRPRSKLVVVAIANTMDLPEREFLGKIRSRLGNNRINFAAYTSEQLIKIVEARLEGLDVFNKDGIKLAAKKVASVTGDARRALDICRESRRTVENVDLLNNTSGKPPRLATANDVVKTYAAMTNSGPLAFVRKLGIVQKVLLFGIVKEGRKRSAGDVEMGDIIRFYLQFTRQLTNAGIPQVGHDDLFAALESLANLRIVVLEPMPGSKRTGYFRRLKALVADEELEPVLREDEKVGRYFK